MPVFFIASGQVRDGLITVTPPLLEHLRSSLRIKPGQDVWFGDEMRRRYRAKVAEVSARALTAHVVEREIGPTPSGPPLVLLPAILKGEKMDWLLQKATELGAGAIRPVITRRVIVKPKSDRHLEARWQRIVLEAAQQSERWDVPRVESVRPFNEACGTNEPAERLMLVERSAGVKLGEWTGKPAQAIHLLVGPEGGWEPEEVEHARAAGFIPVTLGDQILRAETAAIAAITLLQHRLGRI